MSVHIMNNTAQMLAVKTRFGLNIKTSTNATSEYLENIRIMRDIKEAWIELKPSFEKRYEKCKFYNYLLISSFISDVGSMTSGRLNQLHQAAIDGNLEDYLLKKMGIKKDQLIYRNTIQTA